MEDQKDKLKNQEKQNNLKINDKIIETHSIDEADQDIQQDFNEKINAQAQMPPPLMINPNKNLKQEQISNNQEKKNGEILQPANAYQIPQVQEFDILKNSQGEFQIEDNQNLEMITPVTMPDNNHNYLKEKKSNNSNQTKNNQGTANQKQQQNQLVKKLFQKQSSQSVIIEHGLNTQTPSSLSNKENNGKDQQKLPKSKREIKQKKALLSLSTSNNIFGFLVKKSNQEVKAFSETENYHSDTFCCDMLYRDDCCLKQVLDLIFQFVFAPFRLMIFIIRICIACCEDDGDDDISNNSEENPCFTCCYNLIYCPFKCCGDWLNQFAFSIKQFICKSLWILPEQAVAFYNSNIQICLIQAGLFFKNCCFFTSYYKFLENLTDCCCLKPFHLLGECLMWLCSPQGFCQKFFKIINFVTCKIISVTCISKLFYCCYSKVQKPLKNNKEISISYFCGCAFDTTGDYEDIEQNL
ncbi:hypothetical protein TTHERM_00794240 (macronuclear) [Tetrahymena thermophila SB210]|uniref:Uncharacterized protein n=1 Tax=Tetrahymena thermophila (strain SB210) TaxID=312017 RepID=Q23W07_TETTS|nr:hypothetical protein TTHERM_00794240 [Tetrahymena thermophila SB210]EAS00698.1 hypothetical protein TTHERM_00794240 [Tetrahymena thermophila SB210]|eukprot:XP_001020943.1 hypothetical protein TTHERM_00794240 [Tetrahymena thermophila SB210]